MGVALNCMVEEVKLILGPKIPLFEDVISKTAEGSGVVVPTPTCANANVELNSNPVKNSLVIIGIGF